MVLSEAKPQIELPDFFLTSLSIIIYNILQPPDLRREDYAVIVVSAVYHNTFTWSRGHSLCLIDRFLVHTYKFSLVLTPE